MTDKTWADVAKEQFDEIDTPITTAKSVRALANCIFATCKDESADREQQLNQLALLGGMACAVLFDYAKTIE